MELQPVISLWSSLEYYRTNGIVYIRMKAHNVRPISQLVAKLYLLVEVAIMRHCGISIHGLSQHVSYLYAYGYIIQGASLPQDSKFVPGRIRVHFSSTCF